MLKILCLTAILTNIQATVLYRMIYQDFPCRSPEAISCSLIQVDFKTVQDLYHIMIPEFGDTIFKKVLHWKVKGTFLTEFIIDTKENVGHLTMLSGQESYALGFMEFNGKKFSLKPVSKSFSLLTRWTVNRNLTKQKYDYPKAMDSYPLHFDTVQWLYKSNFWDWNTDYQFLLLKGLHSKKVAEISLTFQLDPQIFERTGTLGTYGFQMIAAYFQRVNLNIYYSRSKFKGLGIFLSVVLASGIYLL